MELDEYIRELEACPNIEITVENFASNIFTAKFGIDDNFPILMRADYDQVITDFKESVFSNEFFSGQYSHFQELNENYRNNRFNYVPGWVVIQVQDEVNETCCSYDKPLFAHSKKQLKDYNMSLWIHPYQKRIEGVGSCNAMASVIIDISRYAQKRKFPLCINTLGKIHKNDYSKVVYYSPSQ